MQEIKKIYLIDDDTDDQELFIEALTEVDPNVTCTLAGNGQIALDKLLRETIFPSYIFLDINMPIMNGRQFLLEIKKHEMLKNIPVIIYSTTKEKNMVFEMIKLGATKFVTKPENFDHIIEVIRGVINPPGDSRN